MCQETNARLLANVQPKSGSTRKGGESRCCVQKTRQMEDVLAITEAKYGVQIQYYKIILRSKTIESNV